jgi:hypothetical protein
VLELFSSGAGRPSASGPRTVREPRVRRMFIQFLRIRASIFRGVRALLQGVCWTVHLGVSDHPRVGQTVREGSTNSPPSSDRPEARLGSSVLQGCGTRGSVGYSNCPSEGREPSAWCLRTVRLVSADRPPQPCGLSAWTQQICVSLLLLEIHFHFGIVWGLFLGLVGLL